MSVVQVRGPDGDLIDYELFTVKTMEDVLLREWEIDPTDVRLLEKIGEGEFGQVFRVSATALRPLNPPLYDQRGVRHNCWE